MLCQINVRYHNKCFWLLAMKLMFIWKGSDYNPVTIYTKLLKVI